MTVKLIQNPYNNANSDYKNNFFRNIGEIIVSIDPINDAAAHRADGSILSGEGIHSYFVNNFITDLLKRAPYRFCTEEEYQQSITKYGVCCKYVYDSEANTVRLPTITGHIEGTNDITKLGNIIEAGLPNITGKTLGIRHNAHSQNGYASGAFLLLENGYSPSLRIEGGGTEYYCDFDASRCNKVYNNSETVQTQSIEVFYYIVVANSTKTDIQINIDNVVTDLNGKADIDLANAVPSQTFIDKSVGWGMPDYSKAITFTPPAVGKIYTVPYDCFIKVTKYNVGGVLSMRLNDQSGPYVFVVVSATAAVYASDSGFFKKDTKLYIQENNVTSYASFICPLKGVNNA